MFPCCRTGCTETASTSPSQPDELTPDGEVTTEMAPCVGNLSWGRDTREATCDVHGCMGRLVDLRNKMLFL